MHAQHISLTYALSHSSMDARPHGVYIYCARTPSIEISVPTARTHGIDISMTQARAHETEGKCINKEYPNVTRETNNIGIYFVYRKMPYLTDLRSRGHWKTNPMGIIVWTDWAIVQKRNGAKLHLIQPFDSASAEASNTLTLIANIFASRLIFF